MYKITKESVDAFLQGQDFKKANMEVSGVCRKSMYLHGNKIAWFDNKNQLWISNCGWWSNTTKERLNALPNVKVVQRKHIWYLNGERWDGRPICIGRLN